MPAETMVERLVGLQSQNPLDPYVALWSRLDGFRPDELGEGIVGRRLVRIALLRTTLHLATAGDALILWPLLRTVLERVWRSTTLPRQLVGADVEAILGAARVLLEAEPRTLRDLGRSLGERWPGRDPASLAGAVRYLLPIVQLPPRGVWGRTGRPTWTTLEAWLGRPLGPAASADEVVLRYLAAFGPASVADIRVWSGLSGLREVVERLRPRLVTFRDDAGRELFDLPEAPRPDPATPAPPRFLPEYDNLLLAHADRRRVIPERVVARLTGWVGTFLVDGFVRGQWRLDRTGSAATLVVEPFEPLTDHEAEALVAEAESLLAFAADAADDRRVTFGIAREPERGWRASVSVSASVRASDRGPARAGAPRLEGEAHSSRPL